MGDWEDMTNHGPSCGTGLLGVWCDCPLAEEILLDEVISFALDGERRFWKESWTRNVQRRGYRLPMRDML